MNRDEEPTRMPSTPSTPTTPSTPSTIGITLGDPAGVGPLLIDQALERHVGELSIRLYGPQELVAPLALNHPGCTAVPTSSGLHGVIPGTYTAASGSASLLALQRASLDLACGRLAALVTGPIDKHALSDAGLAFPGQTELVASACGVKRFAMMLAGPRLRVVLATTHLALRDVPAAITEDAVFDAADLVADHLRRFEAMPFPRIAVLGLNPHASDRGRFGDEEALAIAPAVARLQKAGIDATGPLPADTAFHHAVEGAFDAVVAMYHDQGLGPLKLLHFTSAINVTLGLQHPRCSPDHGPAFDLVGTGRADPGSMIQALRFAARCT